MQFLSYFSNVPTIYGFPSVLMKFTLDQLSQVISSPALESGLESELKLLELLLDELLLLELELLLDSDILLETEIELELLLDSDILLETDIELLLLELLETDIELESDILDESEIELLSETLLETDIELELLLDSDILDETEIELELLLDSQQVFFITNFPFSVVRSIPVPILAHLKIPPAYAKTAFSSGACR